MAGVGRIPIVEIGTGANVGGGLVGVDSAAVEGAWVGPVVGVDTGVVDTC